MIRTRQARFRDISMLGHFASKLAAVQFLTDDLAREASDKTVGVYRACQLFAFLPFQLLITLTFIMFPMLEKAKAERDEQAVASYVRTGMRLAFVFACVMVGDHRAHEPWQRTHQRRAHRHRGNTCRVLECSSGHPRNIRC